MSAPFLISRYNKFNGTTVTIETVKTFRDDVARFIDSAGSDPNIKALREILSRTDKTIAYCAEQNITSFKVIIQGGPVKVVKSVRKKKQPVKATVVKPRAIPVKKIKVVEPVKPITLPVQKPVKNIPQRVVNTPPAKKPGTSPGLPTSSVKPGLKGFEDLRKDTFKEILLSGRYKADFLKLFNDTIIMLWGMPGHGKTVYMLQFAQYLAEVLNMKILYIAREEYGRSTLHAKIIEFNIGHPNLKVVKDLKQLKQEGHSVDDFEVIFLDSVNALKMKLTDFEDFTDQHPGKIIIAIIQSNKDGSFRGGNDWLHFVDVGGEILNFQLVLHKNRLDRSFKEKAQALEIQSKAQEINKRKQITDTARATIKPKPQKQTVMLSV